MRGTARASKFGPTFGTILVAALVLVPSAYLALGMSGPVNASGYGTPPSAPRDLTAKKEKKNDTILLQWQPPVNSGSCSITNYKIYRGTSSGRETFYVKVGDTHQYEDSNTVAGTTYYYEVTAVNCAGEGPFSNEASAKA